MVDPVISAKAEIQGPEIWADCSARTHLAPARRGLSIYRVFRPVIYTDIRPPWGVVSE